MINPAKKYQKLEYIHKNLNHIMKHFSEKKGTETDVNFIMNKLWLGNWKSAYNYHFINAEQIRHIINVTANIPNRFRFIKYTNLPITDIDACYTDMLFILEKGADVIHHAMQTNQPVLVHCKRGHHRSASVIAFYLMKYHNMKLLDAIYIIKQCRPTSFRRMTCTLQTLIRYEVSKNDEI